MALNDKAVLFVPSHLGYGEAGMPGAIPPNTNLIFGIFKLLLGLVEGFYFEGMD